MSRTWVRWIVCTLTVTGIAASVPPLLAGAHPVDPGLIYLHGPLSLVHSPLAAYDTDRIALWAALGSGGPDTSISRLIGYTEPDTGLGAGALYWYDERNGTTARRELAYSVARRLTDGVVLGVAAKHIKHPDGSGFAGDVALRVQPFGVIQAAAVVRNVVSSYQPASTTLRLSAAVEVLPDVSVYGMASLPVCGEVSEPTWTAGLDVTLGRVLTLSAGRSWTDPHGSKQTYVGVQWRISDVVVSVSAVDLGSERSYAIGLVYEL